MSPIEQIYPSNVAPPMRRLNLALFGAAILLLLALTAFYFSSRRAHEKRADEDGAIIIAIQGKQCNPNTLTIPAGKTTFKILNQSSRTIEWEILDGVMMVEERENIAPNFTQLLTVILAAGNYQITCGLLSNPRGTLHVIATDTSKAALTARPSLVNFISVLAEYHVYLMQEVNNFVTQASALAEAVDAGQFNEAREHYMFAYAHYAQLEPASSMFTDLATHIDGEAVCFDKREADPAFRGFRRLGPALFCTVAVDSCPPVIDWTVKAQAHQLAKDAEALRLRLRTVNVLPECMISGSADLARRIAAADNESGRDGTDSAQMRIAVVRTAAALEGMHKVHELLYPLLERYDSALANHIDANFNAARAGSKLTALKELAVNFDKVEKVLSYE